MTADVNVTEEVARALFVRTVRLNATHDEAVTPWGAMPEGAREYWLPYATAALAVFRDPDMLAGMAGDLVQRRVLGCCVDCPTPHTRSDHEEQAREVAAAVVEWLTGGAS